MGNTTAAAQGVTSINSYTISGGTATGAATICLVKPLMFLPMISANVPVEKDMFFSFPSFPVIQDNACLGIIFSSTVAYAQNGAAAWRGRLRYAWN